MNMDSSIKSLVQKVAMGLQQKGWRLVTAESCTGGSIGSYITALPGSSGWYDGGVISYSNALKIDLLGVESETLVQHGAVSEAVAQQMAHGARLRLQADIAVSVTGIAGPDGGTEEKPVGTVWIGWSTSVQCYAQRFCFVGDREQVRQAAVLEALRGIEKNL